MMSSSRKQVAIWALVFAVVYFFTFSLVINSTMNDRLISSFILGLIGAYIGREVPKIRASSQKARMAWGYVLNLVMVAVLAVALKMYLVPLLFPALSVGQAQNHEWEVAFLIALAMMLYLQWIPIAIFDARRPDPPTSRLQIR